MQSRRSARHNDPPEVESAAGDGDLEANGLRSKRRIDGAASSTPVVPSSPTSANSSVAASARKGGRANGSTSAEDAHALAAFSSPDPKRRKLVGASVSASSADEADRAQAALAKLRAFAGQRMQTRMGRLREQRNKAASELDHLRSGQLLLNLLSPSDATAASKSSATSSPVATVAPTVVPPSLQIPTLSASSSASSSTLNSILSASSNGAAFALMSSPAAVSSSTSQLTSPRGSSSPHLPSPSSASSPTSSSLSSSAALSMSLPELEQRRGQIRAELEILQRECGRKLPKGPEPPRNKVHWDYLLEESVWMANDFKLERKWKMAVAKKLSRAVLRYHAQQQTKAARAEKQAELLRRKLAAFVSRDVKKFWHKAQSVIDQQRKHLAAVKEQELLDSQLEALVGKTEQYSARLAQGLSAEDEESSSSSSSSSSAMDFESQAAKAMEAAKAVAAAQPIGTTLSTQRVKTKIPFLLRHGSLREYQHIGLDWLVTMHDQNLNGILADEMGLGKTVMTIALLGHLACERQHWGPHLIVVPTSVMLNWEVEFKRWLPAFKVVCYHGSRKEREAKRRGWSRPDAFHVCITSYKLVVQDAIVFRRKNWSYMILDEAHNIKNFKSQRWQTLLSFKTQHRLLLTGTPLQNNLMELWSLMHFLMPTIFASQREFKEWFNPVNSMIEGKERANQQLIDRLHGVLRPFLLRRLKSEVAKQLPPKFEHAITCRLSKRQRQLYDEFMANVDTKATLSSGNYLGLMNILMQLRKVCNHPDLFAPRPIHSPFEIAPLTLSIPACVADLQRVDAMSSLSLSSPSYCSFAVCNISPSHASPLIQAICAAHALFGLSSWQCSRISELRVDSATLVNNVMTELTRDLASHLQPLHPSPMADFFEIRAKQLLVQERARLQQLAAVNAFRCSEAVARSGSGTVGCFGFSEGWKMSSLSTPLVQSLTLPPSVRLAPLAAACQSPFARLSSEPSSSGSAMETSSSSSASACYSGKSKFGSYYQHLDVNSDLTSGILGSACTHVPRFFGEVIQTYEDRALSMQPVLEQFTCLIPRARAALSPLLLCRSRDPVGLFDDSTASPAKYQEREFALSIDGSLGRAANVYRPSFVRMQLNFPDKRLLQFDCGKLQMLDKLLRERKAGGHRALIFTQMTKMLDVLEVFINMHGYTYLRLDGSTKIEDRQKLMERFNTDPRIFLFILSTRSGGVGVNLTGADSVIFYDTDWNPAMDNQAQDRCHRIGQTREVNIFRLISENTVEENILKKANQKRLLDAVVIGDGKFTTDRLSSSSSSSSSGGMGADDLLGGSAQSLEQLRSLLGLEDEAPRFSSSSSSSSSSNRALSTEQALAAMRSVEDDGDRLAADELAREQQADVDEFDETIEIVPDDEASQLERMFGKHLKPVERYALRFSVRYMDALPQADVQASHEVAMAVIANAPTSSSPAASSSSSSSSSSGTSKRKGGKAAAAAAAARAVSNDVDMADGDADASSSSSKSKPRGRSSASRGDSAADETYRSIKAQLYEEARFDLLDKKLVLEDDEDGDGLDDDGETNQNGDESDQDDPEDDGENSDDDPDDDNYDEEVDEDEDDESNENLDSQDLFYEGSSTDAVMNAVTKLQQEGMLFDQPTLEPPRVSEADELYVSPLDLAYERETEWGLFSTDQSIARMLPSAEIKRPRISLTVRIPASRLPPQFLAKRRAGGSSSSGAANAGQAADDASKAAAEEAARRAKEELAEQDRLLDLPPLQPMVSLLPQTSLPALQQSQPLSSAAVTATAAAVGVTSNSLSAQIAAASAAAAAGTVSRPKLSHVPDSRYQWTDIDDQALLLLVSVALALVKTSCVGSRLGGSALDDELDSLWSSLLSGVNDLELPEEVAVFVTPEPLVRVGVSAEIDELTGQPTKERWVGAFCVPTRVSTNAAAWMRNEIKDAFVKASAPVTSNSASLSKSTPMSCLAQLNWGYITDVLNTQSRVASHTVGRDRTAAEVYDRYIWLQQLRDDDLQQAVKCQRDHTPFVRMPVDPPRPIFPPIVGAESLYRSIAHAVRAIASQRQRTKDIMRNIIPAPPMSDDPNNKNPTHPSHKKAIQAAVARLATAQPNLSQTKQLTPLEIIEARNLIRRREGIDPRMPIRNVLEPFVTKNQPQTSQQLAASAGQLTGAVGGRGDSNAAVAASVQSQQPAPSASGFSVPASTLPEKSQKAGGATSAAGSASSSTSSKKSGGGGNKSSKSSKKSGQRDASPGLDASSMQIDDVGALSNISIPASTPTAASAGSPSHAAESGQKKGKSTSTRSSKKGGQKSPQSKSPKSKGASASVPEPLNLNAASTSMMNGPSSPASAGVAGRGMPPVVPPISGPAGINMPAGMSMLQMQQMMSMGGMNAATAAAVRNAAAAGQNAAAAAAAQQQQQAAAFGALNLQQQQQMQQALQQQALQQQFSSMGGIGQANNQQQFLKFVVQQKPEVRQRIYELLQQRDLNQQQKVDMIARLIRDNQGGSGGPSPSTS